MIKNIAITLIIVFSIVLSYKLGDKRGFEEGFHQGYIYDCKDEVRSLQRAAGDLNKAVKFAEQSVSQVKRENDSLKNYEVVKKLNSRVDSLNNLDSVYRPRYDVDGNVSTKELNKAIHKNGGMTDDVLKGIAGIK